MKLFLVFLSALLLVASCTSFESQSNLVEFEKAVTSSQKGEVEKAKVLFRDLCDRKHRASCLVLGEKVPWRANLGIMQGPTTNNQTEFVVSHRDLGDFRAYVLDTDSKKLFSPSNKIEEGRNHSTWSLVRLGFKGLKVGSNYTLFLVTKRGELVDSRQFKTLDITKNKLSFTVLSCMRDDLSGIDKIWKVHRESDPDVVFMIGDNSYLDLNVLDRTIGLEPKVIWDRHQETRNKLPFFFEKNLKPVYGVWDDHDFGVNNGGKDFPYVEASRKIFESFFPMPADHPNLSQGPGLARSVRLGGQQFLFLDNRSYRAKKGDDKRGSHFGDEQTQWLIKQLEFKGRSWLISGGQFFGGYHRFESFQGDHPKDFKNFLALLKKTKRKVLFVSGDRHMSEIMKIPSARLGYNTYEFTSSPVHSGVHPESESKEFNPLAIEKRYGHWNFLLFETKQEKVGATLQIKVTAKGKDGQRFFERKLNL